MVVYIDKQQVVDFARQSSQNYIDGVAYEWENEDVVHIRTVKLLHAFGMERCALFIKSDSFSDDFKRKQYDFIIIVSENAHTQVLRNNGEKYCEIDATYIPAKNDLYSRNKGLIEVDILKEKRVTIIGLGSFGSVIVAELAKAGVGNFALFDFDRLELHNLSRHYCGINDLGRLKTDALYDVIKGKNPYANVEKFPIDINKDVAALNNQIEKSDLIICATDNNKSRFLISESLVRYQKVGIFGRAVTRAEGGDVFRYRPGGACYCCLVGNNLLNPNEEEITDETSARRNGRIAAYVSPEDADAMVQVGLSSDIEPITNLMVKLALIELSKGKPSGISSLEDELPYDYYMWANRRERRHINWCSYSNNPNNGPTILRWYPFKPLKNENCPICNENYKLITD